MSAAQELAAWRLACAQGLRFPFRGQGLSMWPTLRPGDEALFEPLGAPPRVGDILLAHVPSGLVAHRLVRVLPEGLLVLRGDAMPAPDPPLEPAQVLGRLVAVRRRGRERAPGLHPWRLYHAAAPALRLGRAVLARLGRGLTLPGRRG